MISDSTKDFIKEILDGDFESNKKWIREKQGMEIPDYCTDAYMLGCAKITILFLVEELQKHGELTDIKV